MRSAHTSVARESAATGELSGYSHGQVMTFGKVCARAAFRGPVSQFLLPLNNNLQTKKYTAERRYAIRAFSYPTRRFRDVES